MCITLLAVTDNRSNQEREMCIAISNQVFYRDACKCISDILSVTANKDSPMMSFESILLLSLGGETYFKRTEFEYGTEAQKELVLSYECTASFLDQMALVLVYTNTRIFWNYGDITL